MKYRAGASCCLAALAALSLSGTAGADEYHYTNILVGNRASGMGGAYTAVSDDPSGTYYNPAGIAYTRGSNLSASVNAYHTTETRYKSALGGSRDWTRSSSTLLPNFFAIVQSLGDGVVGLSYAVPDTIAEDQDQVFEGFPSAIPGIDITRYTINFNQNDNTYKFGPSYARAFSDDFSVGLTLYYHYRDQERIQNEYVILSDGRFEWSNSYLETTEHGFEPTLGLMWSPSARTSLGLTLSRTLITHSTTKTQRSVQDILGQPTPPDIETHDDKREFPMQVRLGWGYFASDRLLVSADLHHSAAHEYDFGGRRVEREAVNDLALGVEYYPSSRWALRGGLYTSYANTPEIDGDTVGQEEHVDILGITTSVSRFTRNSALTAGIGYSQGDGRAQLFQVPGYQDVETSSLTLFVSTSYHY